MSERRKTVKELLFERDIEMSFAASDVMSVIRHGLRSEVWRHDLMCSHFQMVYHYAHYENERIDYTIKNASSMKTPGLADRIIKSITGTSSPTPLSPAHQPSPPPGDAGTAAFSSTSGASRCPTG